MSSSSAFWLLLLWGKLKARARDLMFCNSFLFTKGKTKLD